MPDYYVEGHRDINAQSNNRQMEQREEQREVLTKEELNERYAGLNASTHVQAGRIEQGAVLHVGIVASFNEVREQLNNDWMFLLLASKEMKNVRSAANALDNDSDLMLNLEQFDTFFDNKMAAYNDLIEKCRIYVEARKNKTSKRGERRRNLVDNMLALAEREKNILESSRQSLKERTYEQCSSEDRLPTWRDVMLRVRTTHINSDNIVKVTDKKGLVARRMANMLNIGNQQDIYEKHHIVSDYDTGETSVVAELIDDSFISLKQANAGEKKPIMSEKAKEKLKAIYIMDFILGYHNDSNRDDTIMVKTEMQHIDGQGEVLVVTDCIARTRDLPPVEVPNTKCPRIDFTKLPQNLMDSIASNVSVNADGTVEITDGVLKYMLNDVADQEQIEVIKNGFGRLLEEKKKHDELANSITRIKSTYEGMKLPKEIKEMLDKDLDSRMREFVENYRNGNLDMPVDTSPIMKEAARYAGNVLMQHFVIDKSTETLKIKTDKLISEEEKVVTSEDDLEELKEQLEKDGEVFEVVEKKEKEEENNEISEQEIKEEIKNENDDGESDDEEDDDDEESEEITEKEEKISDDGGDDEEFLATVKIKHYEIKKLTTKNTIFSDKDAEKKLDALETAISSARAFFEEKTKDTNLQKLFNNEMTEQLNYVKNTLEKNKTAAVMFCRDVIKSRLNAQNDGENEELKLQMEHGLNLGEIIGVFSKKKMTKVYKLEAKLHDTLKEKCNKEVSDTLSILGLDEKIKEDISLEVKTRNAKLYKEFMETKSGLRLTMLDVKVQNDVKDGDPVIDNDRIYRPYVDMIMDRYFGEMKNKKIQSIKDFQDAFDADRNLCAKVKSELAAKREDFKSNTMYNLLVERINERLLRLNAGYDSMKGAVRYTLFELDEESRGVQHWDNIFVDDLSHSSLVETNSHVENLKENEKTKELWISNNRVSEQEYYEYMEKESQKGEISEKVVASKLAQMMGFDNLFEKAKISLNQFDEPAALVENIRQGYVSMGELFENNKDLTIGDSKTLNVTYSIEAFKKLQGIRLIDYLMGLDFAERENNIMVKYKEAPGSTKEKPVYVITDVYATENRGFKLKKETQDIWNQDMPAFDAQMIYGLLKMGDIKKASSDISEDDWDEGKEENVLERNIRKNIKEQLFKSLSGIISDERIDELSEQIKKVIYNYEELELLENEEQWKSYMLTHSLEYSGDKNVIKNKYISTDRIHMSKEISENRLSVKGHKVSKKKKFSKEELARYQEIKDDILAIQKKKIGVKSGDFKLDHLNELLDSYVRQMEILTNNDNQSDLDKAVALEESEKIRHSLIFRINCLNVDYDEYDDSRKILRNKLNAWNSKFFAYALAAGSLEIPKIIDGKKVTKPKVASDDYYRESFPSGMLGSTTSIKKLPLFVQMPSIRDVAQGNFEDSGLANCMKSLLNKDPEFFLRHMKDNGDSVTVKFYKTFDGKTEEKYITVSKYLYTDINRKVKKNEKYTNYVGLGMDMGMSNSVWAAMYEKAYGEYLRLNRLVRKNMNPYLNMNEDINNVMLDMTGNAFSESVRVETSTYDRVEEGMAFETGMNVENLKNHISENKQAGLEKVSDRAYEAILSGINANLKEMIDRRFVRITRDVGGPVKYTSRNVTIDDVQDIINDFKHYENGEIYQNILQNLKDEGIEIEEAQADLICRMVGELAVEQNARADRTDMQQSDQEKLQKTDVKAVLEHREKSLYETVTEADYSKNALKMHKTLAEKLSGDGQLVCYSRRYTKKSYYRRYKDRRRNGFEEGSYYKVVEAYKDEETGHLMVRLQEPRRKYGYSQAGYKDADGQEKTFTHVNNESQNGIFDIDMNDFMRRFDRVRMM